MLVALADLVLGHTMTAGVDPMSDPLDCQLFGNEEDMQNDRVVRRAGGID